MFLQISLVIIILALLGYIIFLKDQITKKNILIESTFKRLSGIEKSRSYEDMMAFFDELQKLGQYNSYFTEKLLDDKSIDFIIDKNKGIETYIHYTKDESVAKNIIREGFKFSNSFYKTALHVTRDKLDLTIKHNSRKFFGEYLIVIAISTDVIYFYSMELEKAGIKGLSFENVLTENSPVRNENADLSFQLSPHFIKGFVNHKTGEIVKNPIYDPWYVSPQFMKNIEYFRLKD